MQLFDSPTCIRGAFALLLAGAALQARAEERILKFADPSSPGKIVVHMGLGDLRIAGADVQEVKVLSDEDIGGGEEARDDGLRRLDDGDNHSVNTAGNTITIACNALFTGRDLENGGHSDLELIVPKGTYLVVQRSGPGDTQIEGLAGDVEMRAAIGDIELRDVSGGVVVEAAHGDVRATFASFPADRPVSISTAHGDVEVRVPADARAKVRFRTLRGEILSDFPKDKLVTRMEQAETMVFESEDMDAARRELEAARADIERAREEAQQAERAAREAEAQARRSARQAGRGADGPAVPPPVPPVPPVPAVPAIPPFAGGKVVAGTLNGGGTELSITALMGDVVFRKTTP